MQARARPREARGSLPSSSVTQYLHRIVGQVDRRCPVCHGSSSPGSPHEHDRGLPQVSAGSELPVDERTAAHRGLPLPAWRTREVVVRTIEREPATDTLGASISATFGLEVLPGNQPPVVTQASVAVGDAGGSLGFDLSPYASDPDSAFWIDCIDGQPQYLSYTDMILNLTPSEEEPGAGRVARDVVGAARVARVGPRRGRTRGAHADEHGLRHRAALRVTSSPEERVEARVRCDLFHVRVSFRGARAREHDRQRGAEA